MVLTTRALARLPYVGVTGFMTTAEVDTVLRDLKTEDVRARVMAGVLLSDKTMAGYTNNHPMHFPKREDIAGIFTDNPITLNLIHYNTHSPYWLADQLCEAMRLGGKNCHGLQLNINWPSVKELEKFRQVYPDAIIVLQIGSLAYDDVDSNPVLLTRQLRLYKDLIDYILIDPSGGIGKSFDILSAKLIIRMLKERWLDESFGIGVAGGIDAINVLDLQELFDLHPQLSIDAQGRLRDEDDNLNTSIARLYAMNALEAYYS